MPARANVNGLLRGKSVIIHMYPAPEYGAVLCTLRTMCSAVAWYALSRERTLQRDPIDFMSHFGGNDWL